LESGTTSEALGWLTGGVGKRLRITDFTMEEFFYTLMAAQANRHLMAIATVIKLAA